MLIGIRFQVMLSLPQVIFLLWVVVVVSVGNKKRQTIIGNSIMVMEVELIALASACEKINWLRDLLFEIPLWEKPVPPILIHCDSTPAIGIWTPKEKTQYYEIIFDK